MLDERGRQITTIFMWATSNKTSDANVGTDNRFTLPSVVTGRTKNSTIKKFNFSRKQLLRNLKILRTSDHIDREW